MFPIRKVYWSGNAIPCHQDSHWRFCYLSITILTLIRLTLNTRRKSPFSSAQILSSGLLLPYTGNEMRYLFLAPVDALHIVHSDLSLLLSARLFFFFFFYQLLFNWLLLKSLPFSYLFSKCWLHLYLLEWQWAAVALDTMLSSIDCSLSAFSMLWSTSFLPVLAQAVFV